MKSGARCLGIAESYRETTSTLAGVVVRTDRTVDDFVFGRCTVGGTDATDAIGEMVERLDREDVHYCLVAGIAPAWYNVLDIAHIVDSTGLPTVSVSFEASEGLTEAIADAFDGEERDRRLETYRDLPDRRRLDLEAGSLWYRAVGLDDDGAVDLLQATTHEGERPEPLRVARLAARAADAWRVE